MITKRLLLCIIICLFFVTHVTSAVNKLIWYSSYNSVSGTDVDYHVVKMAVSTNIALDPADFSIGSNDVYYYYVGNTLTSTNYETISVSNKYKAYFLPLPGGKLGPESLPTPSSKSYVVYNVSEYSEDCYNTTGSYFRLTFRIKVFTCSDSAEDFYSKNTEDDGSGEENTVKVYYNGSSFDDYSSDPDANYTTELNTSSGFYLDNFLSSTTDSQFYSPTVSCAS